MTSAAVDNPIRVLLLEDDDDDAALVMRALDRAAFPLELTRAASRSELLAALAGDLDVVVADYHLPDITALDALPILRERHPDVPVLLVTGALGEEMAARCMREGCSDYVLKGQLARLPVAFAQCLENKRLADRTREAEARVRARDARLRALVANSTEAIALVDAGGTILEMTGVRLLGYDGEVEGRSVHDLVYPDDRPRVRSMLEDLVREPGGFRSAEFRGRHRSGEWLWLGCHARNLLAEPAVEAILLTVRDVSECHRMVESLEESRESLRAQTRALESISRAQGAYLARADWEEAHRSLLRGLLELTGCTQVFSEMLTERGEPLATLEPPGGLLADGACATVLPDLLSRMVASNGPVRIDRPCPCMGEAAWLEAVPIMVGSELQGMLGLVCAGGIRGGCEAGYMESFAQTLGLLYDSHRRSLQHALLERELLQSQKMEAVGRLAGGVAHDFNNLLTAIIGFGEIAMRDAAEDTPLRGWIYEIVAAAEWAASLTRQLLTFSRRHVVAPRNVDLDAVLEDLSKMLHRVIGEDVELALHPSAELDDVWMDPGLVEQIVMNLVVNARDAMPAGGRVDISTGNEWLDEIYLKTHPDAKAGAHVRLTVRDTGSGMSTETQAHIFEPFFTTKGEGKGTGLGLATVYGVVKAAAGHIRLETAPGRGTVFDILLPSQPRAPVAAPSPPAPALGKGRTVLVVEDEAAVRKMVRLFLESGGYRIVEASSGTDALALARREGAVDLLITDVVMPGMNGRELAEAFLRAHAGAAVLFMSGYTDDAVLRAGICWQDVPFIQKPFTRLALLARVEEALSGPPPDLNIRSSAASGARQSAGTPEEGTPR